MALHRYEYYTHINEHEWVPFTPQNVRIVPETSGVYWLGVADEGIIYIGRSELTQYANLRNRLQDHLNSDDWCIAQATHFAFERHSDPVARERQLLIEYKREHGKLPRCNDRIS